MSGTITWDLPDVWNQGVCLFTNFCFLFKDQPDLPTPPSLYHLTALLMKHSLLSLDDLYLYVSKAILFTLLFLIVAQMNLNFLF